MVRLACARSGVGVRGRRGDRRRVGGGCGRLRRGTMPPSRELSTAAEAARELRAIILLAGHVGRNPFADGVDRSVLDLPVRSDRTLLEQWTDQFDAFAAAFDVSKLEVVL